MKTKILQSSLIAVVFIALAFTGCKKEEEGNYIQVGDTTIVLSDGNLLDYGAYASSYNFDLNLVSPEIVLGTSESGNPTYTGEGTRIYFETYSNSSTVLSDGSYTYNYDSYAEFTYDYCYYSLDYDGSSYTSYYIYDGTLTFKNNSDGYEITFNATDENGIAVKLHYKGSLTYYDRKDNK